MIYINLNTTDNGDLINLPLSILIFLILIGGAIIGAGLFIIYRKKRSSSPETIAEEESKILSSSKSEEEFKEFIQEDIIILKSIETTKEIDSIIKQAEEIDEKFKKLSLDKLKDKIESKISVTIDKGEDNKELEDKKQL